MRDKNIQDLLEMMQLNTEIALAQTKDILEYPQADHFIKYNSSSIKAKQEDNLKLLGALNEILNEHQI